MFLSINLDDMHPFKIPGLDHIHFPNPHLPTWPIKTPYETLYGSYMYLSGASNYIPSQFVYLLLLVACSRRSVLTMLEQSKESQIVAHLQRSSHDERHPEVIGICQ